MTTDLSLPEQEHRTKSLRLTPAQVKADYNLVLQVMGSCMEKDQDYGVIPGTDKNTLYKPGAEKLMMVFRLASKPEIQDLSSADEIRYRVITEIIHHPTGTVVGYGVGEASTNEAKYKWRKAGQEEWNDTPEDRRRKKYGEGRDGKKWTTLQVRTEPADLANTVLKMADKRSVISGVLKVTSASSVFAQDLEDMDEDIREAVTQAEEGTMPVIKEPKRKSDAAPAPKAASQPAPESNSAPTDSKAGGETPQKAPAHFRAMDSKVDEGVCETCKGKMAKGEAIWFDTKARRAHHREHYS